MLFRTQNLPIIILFLSFLFSMALSTNAQWRFGGGVELREEDPESGFHARIERQLNSNVDIIGVSLRATAGFLGRSPIEFDKPFNDDIQASANSMYTGISLFTQLEPPFFILHPYAGFGVGLETLGFKTSGFTADGQSFPGFDDTELSGYGEGFLGVTLELFQYLKPFGEFRYVQHFDEFEQLQDNLGVQEGDITSNRRIVFGLMIQI